MVDKENDIIYDATKKDEVHVCCLCECLPQIHTTYWKCPLFENELICWHCCQIECLKNDIDKRFSKKLGREITKEEINKACKNCGKNNATQDEQLAIDLETSHPRIEVTDDEKRRKRT